MPQDRCDMAQISYLFNNLVNKLHVHKNVHTRFYKFQFLKTFVTLKVFLSEDIWIRCVKNKFWTCSDKAVMTKPLCPILFFIKLAQKIHMHLISAKDSFFPPQVTQDSFIGHVLSLFFKLMASAKLLHI